MMQMSIFLQWKFLPSNDASQLKPSGARLISSTLAFLQSQIKYSYNANTQFLELVSQKQFDGGNLSTKMGELNFQ